MSVHGTDKDIEFTKVHDNMLQSHDNQLKIQAEQIKQLQDNSLKLENIVMRESRETRATITETNKQLMSLMNDVLDYKTGHNQFVQSVTIARWESIAKIVGVLAGSGGILYYIFGGI